MTSLDRQLIQIVEIDIERCSLSYGNSPCAAALDDTGVRKCYNTNFTCQNLPNFTTETETLRFAMNVDGLPRADRIYPVMSSPVSTNPSSINLGGVGDKAGPLGKRARVTVQLQDFQDSDIWFDRYQPERISGAAQTDEPGYNPMDRGTFFAKFRRRFPYYVGRSLRVLEGTVGQDLADMRTRNYVISEWKGPDAAGRVTITAKDIFDIADNARALCPAPSVGKLGADIEEAALASFDLTPEDVGEDYPSSGRASIGSEVVSFSRSGDNVTLTGRGLDGTETSGHGVGDLFQLAFHVENVPVADVASSILRDFANVPSGFVPLSDWQAEGNRWLAGFNLTATITKPTGVTDLMGELAQFGIIWWWDDEAQEIKMRANRPIDINETAPALSDRASIIEKTIQNEDLHNERLSRVLLWHGQLDVSSSSTDGNNYRRVSVPIDPAAEGEDQYNQMQAIEVFNRWLGVGSDAIADAVAGRLLNRYRDTPQQITFSYDVKDVEEITLASPIEVTTRVLVDETGNSLPTQMQVTSIEEIVPGHRLIARAQSYQFDGNYGFITEDTRPDYNSSTEAQRERGTYIVGPSMEFDDGRTAYVMF